MIVMNCEKIGGNNCMVSIRECVDHFSHHKKLISIEIAPSSQQLCWLYLIEFLKTDGMAKSIELKIQQDYFGFYVFIHFVTEHYKLKLVVKVSKPNWIWCIHFFDEFVNVDEKRCKYHLKSPNRLGQQLQYIIYHLN